MKSSWLLCLCFGCCVAMSTQRTEALDWATVNQPPRPVPGDVILIQHEEPEPVTATLTATPKAAEEVQAETEIVSSPEGDYVYLPGSDPDPYATNYPAYADPTQSWDYNVAESLDDGDFGSVVEPVMKGTHFGAFGDYLYLTPRNAEVPFAAPFDLFNGPNGPVATVDPGYNSGYRFGAFVTVCPDTTIRGTYTTYGSSDSESIAVQNPGTALPTNLLLSLVDFPGFSLLNFATTAEAASASYEISYQMIDLDYEAITIANDTYWGGFILGARYAKFDQDFNAAFQNVVDINFNQADSLNVNSVINFEGIGIRGGLQGERHLFSSSGFRVYGQGVLSLLAGEFTSSYRMQVEDLGININTSYTSDRIVPVIDLEAGLAWVSSRQRVRISGGYMISAWYNIVSTNDWIQAVQQQSFTNMQDHITFDGLVARAQVSF